MPVRFACTIMAGTAAAQTVKFAQATPMMVEAAAKAPIGWIRDAGVGIAFGTGGAWIFYFADAPTLLSQIVSGTAPLRRLRPAPMSATAASRAANRATPINMDTIQQIKTTITLSL